MINEIPRRLSVHDEDYDAELGMSLRIALDGVEQQSVVAYDVVEGTVTRHVLDAAGKAQVEPGWDRVWVETVSDDVQVSRL
jgi:hypothetical protein